MHGNPADSDSICHWEAMPAQSAVVMSPTLVAHGKRASMTREANGSFSA